jgi:hypothetical protein
MIDILMVLPWEILAILDQIIDRNISMTTFMDSVRVRELHDQVVVRILNAVPPWHLTVKAAAISATVPHHT